LLKELRFLLENHCPPRMAMIHARKFLSWYAAGFPGCHEFRKRVFAIQEPDALWTDSEEFFIKTTQERDLQFLEQPFLMGGHG
jgi:hypothetical protein